MGTKVYTPWVKQGDIHHRIWFDYTVSTNNDTTYTLTISAGMDLKCSYPLGSFTGTPTIAVSGTGQTTKTSSGTVTYNIAKANTVYSKTCIPSFTYPWTKEKSSASKTVSVYGINDTSNKASKSFTVAPKTSYTVSYNANNGSGAPSSQKKWHGEALTLSTTKPTRSYYTFSGWATSASGAVAYAAGGTVAANTNTTLTLYAKWTANKAILKYNANGATQDASSDYYPISSYTTSINYNNVINPINIGSFKLSKTGYHAKSGAEWNTNASGTGTSYAQDVTNNYTWTTFGSSTASSKTTTLYANWEANTYTVAYNGNGSTSGSTANSSHIYNTAKALTTNGYARTDYTFKGWATSSSGSVVYANGASVKNLTSTNNATYTLYAVWDYNYIEADISNVTALRVNTSVNPPVPDDTGTHGQYVINIIPARDKMASGTGYITTNVYIDYKAHSSSTWTTLNASNPIVVTDATVVEGYFKDANDAYIKFNTEVLYDIRIRAEGVVSGSVKTDGASRTTFISKAEFTVDISANGKCIGIFTPADDNLDNTILINGETYHSRKSVVGKYYNPVSNFSDYGFVVGNGTSESSRSNALTVDWNGFIQHRSLVMSSDSNVTAPSNNTTLASNLYYDINNHQIGYDQIVLNTSNNLYRSFGVTRQVNNATVTHAMYMGIETSGDRYVSFSDPQAWRNGLGLKRGSSITRTYTSNNYVNQTNFNRLAAYQIGNLVYITGNLSLSAAMPKSSDWVTIGSFPITPNVTWYESVAGCGAGSNIPALGVQITTSGVIQIYNYSNTSAPSGVWYRFTAIIPIE